MNRNIVLAWTFRILWSVFTGWIWSDLAQTQRKFGMFVGGLCFTWLGMVTQINNLNDRITQLEEAAKKVGDDE